MLNRKLKFVLGVLWVIIGFFILAKGPVVSDLKMLEVFFSEVLGTLLVFTSLHKEYQVEM